MKDLKLGLKLFTNQLDLYKHKAIELWEQKKFSYIEVFVNPDQLNFLPDWENFKNKYSIPFTIHAPQYSEGVNLSQKEFGTENKRIYAQVKDYAKALDVMYIVAHCGMDGTIEETVRQLNNIDLPAQVNVENIPYCSRRHPNMYCQGSIVEEIEYVKNNTSCGFCLDVGHAFCSAVKLGFDQYKYMEKFNNLKPDCYHLSDGRINEKHDVHLHLPNGDYDWQRIMNILNSDKNMTLETILKSSSTLDDIQGFEQDVTYLNSLEHRIAQAIS